MHLQPTCEGTSPLKTGQVARVAAQPTDRQQKRSKARVEDQVDIRSYRVRTEDGRVFRRNWRHLQCSKESFYPSDNTTGLQINLEPQAALEEVTTKQSVEPETPQSPPREPKSPLPYIYLIRKVQSSQ